MANKAEKYILSVTAGPDYTDQKPVPVNSPDSVRISSPHLTANLSIRIQNYRGQPAGSPSTSPYFSHPKHKNDLYSLSFTFTPKADLNGHDLVLGNDFDHPIRNNLPPGFNQAFKLVTWFIDPGMYADVQADEPYLYGPLLSSINQFRIGPSGEDDATQERVEESRANAENGVHVVLEGADGDGAEVRSAQGIPDDAAARQKFFLNESHLRDFTFEKGREYSNDFFNPYLDFNDFSIKLPSFSMFPGVTIPVLAYWDQQPLRYVLKNRKTNEPLLVIIMTLLPKDDPEKKAEEKPVEGSSTTNDDDLD